MNHTPSRWLIGLLLALALVATACGGDNGGTDVGTDTTEGTEAEEETIEHPPGSTMAEIQERGTITVGTKFDQPLFGLKRATTGEVEGFDVEIAKLIAEAIDPDLEMEFVETPSAVREDVLVNGDVDMVVATYTINDKRKERVGFAGPYYVAGQDIMVPAGNPEDIQGVDDLNGKRVCSVQGSTSIENVREMAPDAEVTEFATYSQCADAMSDGRVDAVSTDNVILLGLIEESGGEFELVGNPFTTEPYGIGVPKEDDEFRNFINDRLEEIFENGEWAEAYERTVGKVAEDTPEPPEIDRY
ncbi:MAG: glutamate ABC transporter substrate-binding protein [Actinomycetota bacterium]|nr:glutamate ABC transporter substrate-binding protein [Actinomycetota bacterium]